MIWFTGWPHVKGYKHSATLHMFIRVFNYNINTAALPLVWMNSYESYPSPSPWHWNRDAINKTKPKTTPHRKFWLKPSTTKSNPTHWRHRCGNQKTKQHNIIFLVMTLYSATCYLHAIHIRLMPLIAWAPKFDFIHGWHLTTNWPI